MIDLYRFFDSAGELLYIGISLSVIERARQHRADKDWWPEVARIDVEHLAVERERALAVEARAIRRERPRYNVVHGHARRATPGTADRRGPRPSSHWPGGLSPLDRALQGDA